MIDLFNYTDINANHQTFLTNGSSNSWQSWLKPKGASYVYITCIGGGGGGGSSPNVAGAAGGGGGGGSSAVTKLLVNANMIPDLLYIQVGTGGTGGVNSGASTNGTLSYVSILPNITSTNVIIASGTAEAEGGIAGTGVAAGGGGLGGTAFTSAVGILSELGIWQSIAGRRGGNGGIGAAGQNVTAIAGGTFLAPGAGGGGKSAGGGQFAGGSILGIGIIDFNIAGGATNGGAGRGGYITATPNQLTYASTRQPLLSTGGSGGGANATLGGGGGNGGNGQIGCGGGGSGAIDGGTGRTGGRGGDGLVLITTF